MTNSIMTIDGLKGGYGGKPVLQGVELSIPKGEIVAVIGRNGVGKTTLMKFLIGLLPALEGRIMFKGQDISHFPAHQRARLGVGYVPQGRAIFGRMTVEENLSVGLRGRADPAEFERIYQFFPILRERRRQRAGTMSGGQQQQLAIGRVLISRPDLILLDEPSEGIQPSIVIEIGDVMKKISREFQTTIILVEQNIDLIRVMADSCFVMDKGRIVATLEPHEIVSRETVRKYLAV
jgi:branched-chain amino acid transport system ATP-binding protein